MRFPSHLLSRRSQNVRDDAGDRSFSNRAAKNAAVLAPNALAYAGRMTHLPQYRAMFGQREYDASLKNCGTKSRYDATATSATPNAPAPSPARHSRFDSTASNLFNALGGVAARTPESKTWPLAFSTNRHGSSDAFAQTIHFPASARVAGASRPP
eukprot:31331-Pelagococcus_subviridis.AAC.7